MDKDKEEDTIIQYCPECGEEDQDKKKIEFWKIKMNEKKNKNYTFEDIENVIRLMMGCPCDIVPFDWSEDNKDARKGILTGFYRDGNTFKISITEIKNEH